TGRLPGCGLGAGISTPAIGHAGGSTGFSSRGVQDTHGNSEHGSGKPREAVHRESAATENRDRYPPSPGDTEPEPESGPGPPCPAGHGRSPESSDQPTRVLHSFFSSFTTLIATLCGTLSSLH